MKPIDLTGQRIGRLVVRHISGRRNGKRLWLCQCDCGAMAIVQAGYLRQGDTKSCGCLQRELSAARLRTHSDIFSPEYRVWRAMKSRCFNQRAPAWKNYGGRGITVCERWLKYEHFRADMGPRPAGTSIDRINNDGNYEPGNCRWATRAQQNNNTRRSRRTSALALLP